MSHEFLEIVDEQGNVIGTDTRENIHKNGLLHREVHVLFVTPHREIIFEHRAKDKDTFPDLLNSTVGGHVALGDSIEATMVKEIKEETGLDISIEDLHFLKTTKLRMIDPVTKFINNAIKTIYWYEYQGRVENLKVEQRQACGFEVWPIDKLYHLSEEEKKRFVPFFVDNEGLKLYKEIIK